MILKNALKNPPNSFRITKANTRRIIHMMNEVRFSGNCGFTSSQRSGPRRSKPAIIFASFAMFAGCHEKFILRSISQNLTTHILYYVLCKVSSYLASTNFISSLPSTISLLFHIYLVLFFINNIIINNIPYIFIIFRNLEIFIIHKII